MPARNSDSDLAASRRASSWLLTAVAIVAVPFLLGGCGNIDLKRKRADTKPGRPEHWKKEESSSDAPGIFGALINGFGSDIDPGTDPASFYRYNFSLWQRDHKNLTTRIARNNKGTFELMEQAVGSIGGMKSMLQKEEQRQELEEIQRKYERIAEKSLGGFKATAFKLALDRIEWKMKGEFKPGTPGLVYRPASWFKEQEDRDFEEDEDF